MEKVLAQPVPGSDAVPAQLCCHVMLGVAAHLQKVDVLGESVSNAVSGHAPIWNCEM
jgi:hypothetical protein